FEGEWTDLGNWESFLEFYSQNKENYIVGKAYLINSKNCLVFSPYRLAALIGLEDSLVIDSPDAFLVLKKGKASEVKDLVNILKKENKDIVKESPTVYRPWGYYTVLKKANNYKVKEIGVYPKKYISLQKHKFRSEHWNVVEGKAEITLGKKKFIVKRNQSIYVKPKCKHRVYNPTNKILKIIEVQIGSYLAEDDIQRFDAY
ncbi:MAG TPA: cupin domain-containing protein, partial [Candidatus Omnitrophica bacterium]|nr:cupin domain-containing protein [Candidatus Omnitrophota bacterium]